MIILAYETGETVPTGAQYLSTGVALVEKEDVFQSGKGASHRSEKRMVTVEKIVHYFLVPDEEVEKEVEEKQPKKGVTRKVKDAKRNKRG